MFGGLELKGGSNDEEDKTAAAPSSSGGSAFGFLNVTTTPASETTATSEAADPVSASSGFSFLNAAPPAPEPAAAATSGSGFSFMQKIISSQLAGAPEAAAPVPAAAESGFSFLIPSPTADSVDAAPAPEEAAEPAPASAFSFLSAGPARADPPSAFEPAIPAAAPPVPAVSAISSVMSAPSPTPPDILAAAPASLSTSFPAAGAGISFGTAQPKQGVVRKKKTRAQRVGMGAAHISPPTPVAAPAPPKPALSVSASISQDEPPPRSTQDAAADAARRAEEFMHQKTVEHTKTSSPMSIPVYNEALAIRPATSTDEVLVEAKKAAQEAQKLQQQKQTQNKGGGFMGTFFKGFGGSNSSLITGGGGGSGATTSDTTSTNLDRLAKQQQDMKRAAAERQMKLQQQQQPDDADDVIVSTSVGGYQPEPLVSTFTVQTTTNAAIRDNNANVSSVSAISSSFAPAKKQELIVVREMPPVPKRRKTPTQVFEEYQALFAQSVHRAMEQVENVRSQQKMLLEERFVALAKDRLGTQQIAQAEAQLQVAVDEEDYELADQLGQVVDAHNREKAEVKNMLGNIQKGLAQLDSQKTLVVQGVATCFDNLSMRLTELQEKEAATEHSNDKESLKQFASISKQLSAEQERLNQDLKHLERDEQLVTEERKELEGAISEQSGEYEGVMDDVKDKLTKAEEEIVELQKQLKLKLESTAKLRIEMHGLEDSISRVRVKFARQLTRVDKKERAVQENRKEWETEQTTHQRQKDAHEMQVQSHSEALMASDALMKMLESELKLSKEFTEMVPIKLGFMEDETASEEKDDEAEGDLAQLQADVVKCEAAVSEAKILLKAATAARQNLETEHCTLIAKIPELEAQKKAAAAKRDFKAASKASKEIKDATTRLKDCEEELVGEAASRKTVAEEELKKLDVELGVTRKIAQEQEKVSGLAKMKVLAKKIQQLVSTKKELCGETSSTENSVHGVGAMVLDSQIKALRNEGETFGSKYGGWNELIKGIFEDSGADQADKAGETSDVPPPKPEAEEKAAEESKPAVDDRFTSEERVANVKDLMKRLKEVEEALDEAASSENYDKAAEYQEVFERMQMELENIDLNDEEMEIAFADEEPESTKPETSEEETAEESSPAKNVAEEANDETAEGEEVAVKADDMEVVAETETKETGNEGDDQADEKKEGVETETAEIENEGVDQTDEKDEEASQEAPEISEEGEQNGHPEENGQ